MLPQDLNARFHPVRELTSRDHAESDVWLTQDASTGQQVVIKISLRNRSPGDTVLSLIREWNEAHPASVLVVPYELGQAEDGRYFEVTRFHASGSLAEQTNLVRTRRHCEELVRQMVFSLGALHDQLLGGPVVHGDIKPSNILIDERPDGSLSFLLSDFDAARQFDPTSRSSEHPSRYTVRYAAPEVLPEGGEVTPAIDYWSLGMTLLECLTGSRPLADLNDSAFISTLATDWRPHEISQIEDVRWRALISGLLDRVPYSRWNAVQCQRWLEGDIAILSDGLNKIHESASTVSYSVDGIPVISSRNLAHTLLENWATDHLSSHVLANWLREHLHRDDMAALLERLVADDQMHVDIKLLQFCHALYPRITPTWRGRALSGVDLEAASQASIAGDADSLHWLQSLMDGEGFNFFSHREHPEIEVVGQQFLDGWSQYRGAWDAIIAEGAPESFRPADDQALPILTQTLFSEAAQTSLRANARTFLDPVTLLLRESWFLRFGTDIEAMSVAQLLVLQHLDQTSLLGLDNVEFLNDLGEIDARRLREGAVFLESQQRLYYGMVIRAGTDITVLHPGETFRSRPPGHFLDFMDVVLRQFGNLLKDRLARIRDWILRRSRPSSPTSSEGEVSVQLRMVRVTTPEVFQSVPLDIEAYLAMISWKVAEGLRPRLRVTYPGFLLSYPRLITPLLANQGHMLLVLASDTRIQLVARRRWYQRLLRTGYMDVLFRDTPQPFPAKGQVIATQSGVRPVDPDDSETSVPEHQPLRPMTGAVHATGGNVMASETDVFEPDVSQSIHVDQPSRLQNRLWAALSNSTSTR
jgi:serine/threonine protein kinase